MGFNSSLLEENLCNYNYSPICGSLTQEYGSYYTMSLLLKLGLCSPVLNTKAETEFGVK